MDSEEIKKNIDKIENNIELPADSSNVTLQKLQEDKWGKFLNNKTFQIIKDNFLNVKSIFSNIFIYIENYFKKNNENIESIKSDIKNIKDNGIGLKESDLIDYVNKKKENTLEQNLDIKSLSKDNNVIVDKIGDTLTIGNSNININIVGKGEKLSYNGKDISSNSSSSGSSGNDNLNDTMIAEIPSKYTIKQNSEGSLYLQDNNYNETHENYFRKNSIMSIKMNKTYNPIKNLFESNNLNISESMDLAGAYIQGDTVNAEIMFFYSKSMNKFLLDYFKKENLNDPIGIKNICGLRFNLELFVDVYEKYEYKTRDYRLYTIDNDSYAENMLKQEKIFENTYGSELNIIRLFTDFSGSIVVSDKNLKIKLNIKYDYQYNCFVIDMKNKEMFSKISEYYNNNKTIVFRLFISKISVLKLIKFDKLGGGNGNSLGVSSISDSLGFDVFARTISGGYNTTHGFNVKKNNFQILDHTVDIYGLLNGQTEYFTTTSNSNNDKYNKYFLTTAYKNCGYNGALIPICNSLGNLFENMIGKTKIKMPLKNFWGMDIVVSLKITLYKDDNYENSEVLVDIDKKNISLKAFKSFQTNLSELFKNSGTMSDDFNTTAPSNWYKLYNYGYDFISLKLLDTGIFNKVLDDEGQEVKKSYSYLIISNFDKLVKSNINNFHSMRIDFSIKSPLLYINL